MVQTYLLFDTITNEKTVKFMQRDIITSTITWHLGLVGSNNFGEHTSFSAFTLTLSYPNVQHTKDKRISKDKSPSVWFLFRDVILDLSKYKHHELVFNSFYKHALRCVMTMMVLNSYLLKKYFLALHNVCIRFSGVRTVVISQFVIWNQT